MVLSQPGTKHEALGAYLLFGAECFGAWCSLRSASSPVHVAVCLWCYMLSISLWWAFLPRGGGLEKPDITRGIAPFFKTALWGG